MSKKAVIALTVSVSAAVLIVGAAAAGTMICKRIYKNITTGCEPVDLVQYNTFKNKYIKKFLHFSGPLQYF